MYPAELEVKDTTESTTSASYLDLLLSIGRDGQLHTSIYDKRDDFNFHITNFPFRIPFGFSLIWHFLGITFQLLNYFVWLRITDEGSVPEMRIWSILLIKSDLKWCIHLSRSLFLYFNYLVSITACGPMSPRGHMKPSSTVYFGWFVAFESIKISRYKIDWNCNFVGF